MKEEIALRSDTKVFKEIPEWKTLTKLSDAARLEIGIHETPSCKAKSTTSEALFTFYEGKGEVPEETKGEHLILLRQDTENKWFTCTRLPDGTDFSDGKGYAGHETLGYRVLSREEYFDIKHDKTVLKECPWFENKGEEPNTNNIYSIQVILKGNTNICFSRVTSVWSWKLHAPEKTPANDDVVKWRFVD